MKRSRRTSRKTKYKKGEQILWTNEISVNAKQPKSNAIQNTSPQAASNPRKHSLILIEGHPASGFKYPLEVMPLVTMTFLC